MSESAEHRARWARRRVYLDGRTSHRPTSTEAAHVVACVEGHPRIAAQHLDAFERWAAGATLAEVGGAVGRSSTTVSYWLARVWIAYADEHGSWEGGRAPVALVAPLMRVGMAAARVRHGELNRAALARAARRHGADDLDEDLARELGGVEAW